LAGLRFRIPKQFLQNKYDEITSGQVVTASFPVLSKLLFINTPTVFQDTRCVIEYVIIIKKEIKFE